MKNAWIGLILFLIIISAAILPDLILHEELDRTPPWHPFELNSDLTLESIVDDGYRFAYAPCGMVHFQKQIGDTTIYYYIEVDCETYEGKYDRNKSLSDLDFTEADSIDTSDKPWQISEEDQAKRADSTLKSINENPYYPWSPSEINGCRQTIDWRNFIVNLGDTFDSALVRQFIERKGARIIDHMSQWSQAKGGSILVDYPASKLFFICNIMKVEEEYEGEDEEGYELINAWEFIITSSIPKLDAIGRRNEEAWEALKHRYYEE